MYPNKSNKIFEHGINKAKLNNRQVAYVKACWNVEFSRTFGCKK